MEEDKNIFVLLDGNLFSLKIPKIHLQKGVIQYSYPIKPKSAFRNRDPKDYTREYENPPAYLDITEFHSNVGKCLLATNCEIDEDKITPFIINQLEFGNLKYWETLQNRSY